MSRIVIAENDLEKLDMLLISKAMNTIPSEVVNDLKVKLLSAITLPQQKISKRVITMNSRVLLKELGSNRKVEITIAYPKDSDHQEHEVSILSEVGVALLGKSLGNVVNVSIPGSIGHFEIIDVVNQYKSNNTS